MHYRWRNWQSGQPDNEGGPKEACLEMGADGTWSDSECSKELYFICKGNLGNSTSPTGPQPEPEPEPEPEPQPEPVGPTPGYPGTIFKIQGLFFYILYTRGTIPA